jgi:hypothetical protein
VVEGRCGVQLDGPRAGLFNDMHRYLGSKRYRDKLSSEETEGFLGSVTLASDHHGFGMCGTVGHLDNQRSEWGHHRSSGTAMALASRNDVIISAQKCSRRAAS